MLNVKAKALLEGFLSKFGQFLEIDVQGEVEWFYNVTNVVDCADIEKSDKRPSGAIAKQAFFDDKLPTGAAVFQDPKTARTKIYATEAAKSHLEELIAAGGLTGAAFVLPGPPPARPRPTA